MSALKKLLAAALISTMLSSCSFGPTLEKDESARAIFDVENDRVILPLDAYDTTGKDEYYTKALELARKKCFAEHGQHYKMFVRTEGAGRNFGRTYGIWNVEYAQKYGLHEPNESNTLDLSAPAPSSDPGKDVSTECYQRASDEMKQIERYHSAPPRIGVWRTMPEMPQGINSSKSPSTTNGSDASRTRASPR